MFDRFKTTKRLTEHDEALARVERRLTLLEVQWGDTLDRLKTMMGRLLKERQRTEKAAAAFEPEVDDGNGNPQEAGLTARQAEVQARIMARRNRRIEQ